jgi:hypothetical protein
MEMKVQITVESEAGKAEIIQEMARPERGNLHRPTWAKSAEAFKARVMWGPWDRLCRSSTRSVGWPYRYQDSGR